MTAEIPFLGCKISLISKCDIRYEGILYSVDAKESTIALSKVRSFGTEDRVTDSGFIPVKDDVYEYIIFRASDVKDLQVNAQEPPGLSDPAIIRSSFEDRSNTAASNAAAAAAASSLNNGSLSGNGLSNQQQKPLLPFLPTRTSDQRHQDSSRNIPNIPQISSNNAKGNRSNLVSSILSSGKSSQTVPQGNTQGTQHSYASAANQRRRGDRRDSKNEEPRDSRRDDKHCEDRRSDGRRSDRRENSRRDDMRRDDMRRDDMRRDEIRRDEPRREVKRDSRRNDDRDGRRPDSRREHDRDYKPLRDDRRPRDDRALRSSNRGRYDSSRRYDSYNRRNQSDNKGVYNRRPPMRRHRSGDQMGPLRGRKTDPLKFDEEYDFDKANQEFLELEGKLKDMKLKDDEEKDGDFSGDATSKSTAGASESGSAYDSEENHKDGDSKDGLSVSGDFYDKSKSFFDNISCEAVQRSQGKNPKPDWRKERQMNAETFGVSAHYRRGGYRGRVHANGYRR